MELKEEIRKLAVLAVQDDQFVVDIVASTKKGPGKVLVVIDGDHGVSIDDCAEVSRKLSKLLDDSGLLEQNYWLEVSTPGVDVPLKLQRQYLKNIGRKVRVKLHRDEKPVEGRLTAVDEGKIILAQETGKQKEIQTAEIPFADIEKTVVLVSFK